MRTCWYIEFLGKSKSPLQADRQALLRQQLTFEPWQAGHPSSIGVVCIEGALFAAPALTFIEERVKEGRDNIIVVLLADLYQKPWVWKLLSAGAREVLDYAKCPNITALIAEKIKRWHTVESILQSPVVRNTIVGAARSWRKLLKEIIELAVFTKASALVLGESGTGKELVSRLIHDLDTRQEKGELVLVDCSSVSPELSGSEFFGHEKGAFTNAITTREGAFALAHKGTLFLDEIGELPLRLQAELLRVIQEGTYKKIGSNNWKKTVFRLVSATNRNLSEEVSKGNFRGDLYHRLSTWTFTLPPLRERKEDIPLLARHFLKKIMGKEQPPEMDACVYDYLMERDYPGNVRELYQLMNRIACRHVGDNLITIGDIPESDRPAGQAYAQPERVIDELALHHPEGVSDGYIPDDYQAAIYKAVMQGFTLREIKDLAANAAIEAALQIENGKVQKAAKKLNVTERALQLRKATR